MGRGMDALVDDAASCVSPCERPMAAPVRRRHKLALIVERGEYLREPPLARIEVDGRRRILLVRAYAVDRRNIARGPERRRGCREAHESGLAVRKQDVHWLRRHECEWIRLLRSNQDEFAQLVIPLGIAL